MATNADSTITFLDALHQAIDGLVILIWDGLPAHRSSRVTRYIDEQPWLTVHRLPAYAPELNPVEYLWAAIKNKDLANACPETTDQLGNAISAAYKRVETEKALLTGCLKASTLYGGEKDST